MSYNINELPTHINTAGKITVVTAFIGVLMFAAAFILNFGAKELAHVEAQGIATTSVTVLNTPPQWTVDAEEEFESSTSSPTDVGSTTSWVAIGTDSNGEDYYLLICESSATPSTTPGSPPNCSTGLQWAISPIASSGAQARAATTTHDSWSESNEWYAWICDDDPSNPRCNATSKRGTGSTAAPFVVNHRPSFTLFFDNSELITAEPGDTVTFYATTTDPDWLGGNDTKQLIVCSTAAYDAVLNECGATTLATSTFTTATSVTATYLITPPRRDTTYGAFGFIIDEHGFEASGGAQGTDTVLTVYNSAPSILAGDVVLNNGADIDLTVEAGETTGFRLDFTVIDNNSCINSTSGDEIVDWDVVIYRSGISTSTCDTTGANYNANNCYDNAVPTTTWNLSCTASSTSCTGSADDDVIVECTFPLWYIADPTADVASDTPYFAEDWRASVRAIDDDAATSSLTESAIPRELNTFLMFSVDTTAIPYGPLEPGQFNSTLTATTTLRATGNIGLDERLTGTSMCDYYTSAVTCVTSATSTIADRFQTFATTSYSFAYASNTLGNILSSTTPRNLELNVPKSTATDTQATGTTHWGIMVPSSITKAGLYTGENTIYGVAGEPVDW